MARYCPQCGADTSVTGHRPGCLLARRDPMNRRQGGPLPFGISLGLLFWLLIAVVAITWTGSWPAVASFLHDLGHAVAPGIIS